MPAAADAVFVDEEESLLTERLTDMTRERDREQWPNASGVCRRMEDDRTETHAANLTFDNGASHPERRSALGVLFFFVFFFVLFLLVFSLKYICVEHTRI